MSLDIILRDATALIVQPPKVELRAGVALRGRMAEPGNGFRVILRDAAALSVWDLYTLVDAREIPRKNRENKGNYNLMLMRPTHR